MSPARARHELPSGQQKLPGRFFWHDWSPSAAQVLAWMMSGEGVAKVMDGAMATSNSRRSGVGS